MLNVAGKRCVFVYLALVTLATGCTNEVTKATNAARAHAQAQAKNAVTSQFPPTSSSGQAATQYALYIDASQSMQGFVTCKGTPTAFDNALDRLTVDLGIVNITKFGASRSSAPALNSAPMTREVHDGCPGTTFYSALQNPDFLLYNAIDSVGTDVVSLYLTDGVQSDVSLANASPSVARLSKWIADGRALAILAFRSGFSGRAWSESKKEWVGQASVPDRPFYVFAFAANEASMDALIARVSKELLAKAKVIRFHANSVKCTIDFDGIAVQDKDESIPWVMLPSTEMASYKGVEGPIGSYRCTVRDDYPLAGINPQVSNIRYGRWNGTSVEFPSPAPVNATFSTGIPKDGRVPIAARVSDDATTRLGTFTIQLGPSPGPLKSAIADLSTDSDADLQSFSHTYRFSWLIDQLTRGQMSRVEAPRSLSITAFYR